MLHTPPQPQAEKEQGGADDQSRGDAEPAGAKPADGAPGPDAPQAAPSKPARGDAAKTQGQSRQDRPKDEFDDLDERDQQSAMRERTQSNQPGRFKRKCAKVAETYLLSRKETEVLFLLAKGRNAAAIQKTLYIAAGTANTHMRHIYRKLDVHSQQELIRLVEATEVDDG